MPDLIDESVWKHCDSTMDGTISHTDVIASLTMNKQTIHNTLKGSGLGLRRDMLQEMQTQDSAVADFLEITPENWMHIGGQFARQLCVATESYPLCAHGLSLSLGGPAPLDVAFIRQIKHFLQQHQIQYYSEHLSYCSDQGHLYDLLPIPFTDEAVCYVAQRIRQTQDILEQRIAIENVSYYAAPGQQLSEIDFINAVLQEADCDLLLDVNNVYVNSVNHRYNAEDFISALPAARIAYLHIAGHYQQSEDIIIDTHGAEVIDEVWQLLDYTYQSKGAYPTLLERDFNLPPLTELRNEVAIIKQYQARYQHGQHRRIA